jgi:hypothetical protein
MRFNSEFGIKYKNCFFNVCNWYQIKINECTEPNQGPKILHFNIILDCINIYTSREQKKPEPYPRKMLPNNLPFYEILLLLTQFIESNFGLFWQNFNIQGFPWFSPVFDNSRSFRSGRKTLRNKNLKERTLNGLVIF